MRFVFAAVFFVFTGLCRAQITPDTKLDTPTKSTGIQNFQKDTTASANTGLWKNPNKIQDYKIFDLKNDTTFVDTSLSISRNYKFNYLRKDDFELMQLANEGQAYNRLSADTVTSLFPQMGQTAKYYSYMKANEIRYYSMPTPLTEWFFKTTMEQGQILDASISFNTSKQWNFYIAYRGLRSLGKYRHIKSSTGNFRFSTNYHSLNGRYDLKMHFTGQDVGNQENGGILYNDYFTSGTEQFKDRSRLEVIFNDAESVLVGKRYFARQQYNLVHDKDSLHYNIISVGNTYNYETKTYYYTQTSASDYFGDSYLTSGLRDQMKLRLMENQIFVKYSNNLLGDVGFKAINYNYNYLYNSITHINGITIPSGLSGNETALAASYVKRVGGFDLNGEVATTLIGDLGGSKLYAEASYKFNEENSFKASLSLVSRKPDFNYLMYQSDYINYNWYNKDTFENQKINTLSASLNLKKIANIDFVYSMLTDYTYFKEQLPASDTLRSVVAPAQYGGTINYLKLKAQREFKFGKFALDNTFMFQQVVQDEDVLNVPQMVTRNTLYFATPMFKKALFMQTGVTLKYYTQYYANTYNPLLAEFSVQNTEKIGGFPLIDVFLDFKIRQTRFFFKAEHLNSSFTGYDYYTAPNNPYRDFTFRFGLLWNLFS